MLKKILLLSVLLGLLGFVWAVPPAGAQDWVKFSPQSVVVKLENERVRILEWTFKPGDKEPMHTHPEYVVYVLSGGKYRVTLSGGTFRDVDRKAGDTQWSPPQKHSVENTGTTEVRAIIIEFKTNPYK